jgi:hypothetical protein
VILMVRIAHVNNMDADDVACKFCEILLKSCR